MKIIIIRDIVIEGSKPVIVFLLLFCATELAEDVA